jgi:hypothetical protein
MISQISTDALVTYNLMHWAVLTDSLLDAQPSSQQI